MGCPLLKSCLNSSMMSREIKTLSHTLKRPAKKTEREREREEQREREIQNLASQNLKISNIRIDGNLEPLFLESKHV